MFGKRGIGWKIRQGEHSFLCTTHQRDLINIPIKFHEDILNGYRVMEHARMFMNR